MVASLITKSRILKPLVFQLRVKLAGDYDIQLIGHFNQENAVAAGLACLRLGASLEDIKKGIAATRVPGRMEVLTQKKWSQGLHRLCPQW